MKKFLIVYLLFSLLFGVAIYFVTLILVYNQRVFEVYNDLGDEAAENLDFDEFISMQTFSYKMIHREETSDYVIDVYHVIGKEDDAYFNQLGLFIVPQTEVKIADHVEDSNDKTGIKIIKLNDTDPEIFYETYDDEDYNNIAVSYGLSLMAFYFYEITFAEDLELAIEIYDYDKDMFANFNIDLVVQDYPNMDDGFKDRIDATVLEELIDQETYVYPKLIQNMTIYIVLDILIGSVIYFFVKKKQQQ